MELLKFSYMPEPHGNDTNYLTASLVEYVLLNPLVFCVVFCIPLFVPFTLASVSPSFEL